VGVTAVFGLLFPALCDFAQERQNFVGCDGGKIPILAKVTRKLGERPAVRLNRIFSPNSSCGTLDRPELPMQVSWLASFLGCGWVPNRWGIQVYCKISVSSAQQFGSNPGFKVLWQDINSISITYDPLPKVLDLLSCDHLSRG
jgi:hypothetical protein